MSNDGTEGFHDDISNMSKEELEALREELTDEIDKTENGGCFSSIAIGLTLLASSLFIQVDNNNNHAQAQHNPNIFNTYEPIGMK